MIKTKSYKSLGEIFIDLAALLRPPERLSVAQAAEKYRYVNQPGAYVGWWENSTTQYMVEPMNTFTSFRYSGMIFVGPAQSGKALDVDTPIMTPDGFKRMGDICVGDFVLSEDGTPVEVTFVTPAMHNHQCFSVSFDFGTTPIVADSEHWWKVDGADELLLTGQLRPGHRISRTGKVHRTFTVQAVIPVPSRPVKCIQVASQSKLYLAGADCIPTHNTDALVINTVLYSVKVDPMDMMVVCPTQTAARDFSIRRIDRLHRHSEAVGEMLLPTKDADNKFDKQYSTGMMLSLSWPTPTELAGKPIGRIVLTDRDRMDDDIGGDGEPFDLASKRTTTFGSYAMTVAESSPSRMLKEEDALRWIPKSPHEAPPCAGILALYNRGDRRRWYWPCPDCGQYFEGRFTMLEYDRKEGMTNLEVADTVRMICPHCGYRIHPDERQTMNEWGVWLKDGQGIAADGTIFGPEPRTRIASFWLNGVAAGFTNWKILLTLYLDASDEYDRTGSEEALKKFYNNDLGEPYYPKSFGADTRLPETIKARAEQVPEHLVRHVPEGVRFLVATVDVQKNMFVVQVFGILPGMPFDTYLLDRFEIRKSKRTDHDGEHLWVKPNTYLEDWDEITEHVIEKEYPLDDGSGRMMAIKFVACDSGGKEGTTTMAYNYYRKLRTENKHRRFVLLKGDPKPGQPRTRISYPDSSRKDSKSGARGDVPVLMLNSNLLKDDLNGRLDCITPGKGQYRTPDWLADNLYAELCAEVRTDKGWINPSQSRNEAWDLSYYAIGLCVSELIRIEAIDWANPPRWAAPWENNDLVRLPKSDRPFANTIKSDYDFAAFAKSLA